MNANLQLFSRIKNQKYYACHITKHSFIWLSGYQRHLFYHKSLLIIIMIYSNCSLNEKQNTFVKFISNHYNFLSSTNEVQISNFHSQKNLCLCARCMLYLCMYVTENDS